MTATPKRGRGRPAFVPTTAQRRTVAEMAAVGESHDTIARALGINRETLAKYFDAELTTGAAKKRMQVIAWMFKFAAKGNATLLKQLAERTGAAVGREEFDKSVDAKMPSPPRRPKLGKKEIQREEAFTAGLNSEWGEDLAPLPGTKPN